jgi:predicted nucleic acid-binding protein
LSAESFQAGLSSQEVAADAHERYRLSWHDSLIVCAARQTGPEILYSENHQHGQQFWCPDHPVSISVSWLV